MSSPRISLRKTIVLLPIFAFSSITHAELPKAFNYENAGTNYVDNSSSGGGLMDKSYYVGGAMGQSTASDLCSGATSCEDNDSAWKIFGGYKIMEKVSVEAAYVNLGDVRQNGNNSDISVFGAYGVAALPVTEKFEAFGKLGAAHWKSKNADGGQSGFGMSYGLGGKMVFNETTKLRAEWEKVQDIKTSVTTETDVNLLSIGVEFTTF